MESLHLVSYFFGGAFLANGLPHFISGVMGRPFQSPFAKPRGKGLSSATVNVLWGFFNFFVSYLLTGCIGDFGVKNPSDAAAFGLGLLAMGLMCPRLF